MIIKNNGKLLFATVVLIMTLAVIGSFNLYGPTLITGAGTSGTGTAQITISGAACLILTDAAIDMGNGSVNSGSTYSYVYSNGNASYNGSWAAVVDYFEVENCGSTELNVSIKIDDTDFVGGTSAKTYFSSNDTAEDGSCTYAEYAENTWALFDADDTNKNVCDNLTTHDTTDSIRVHVAVLVPSDAPSGTPTASITFTGVSL